MIYAYHGTKADSTVVNSILEKNFQKVGAELL
jgi:hypothetical protein